MLKLGLPSKGRLQAQCFDWFAARGIRLHRSGADREYSAVIEGMAGVTPVLLSAGEIPRELAAGRIHLGITGSDLVRERLPRWPGQVEELARLGFGRADLVLAVPRCWVDVDTLEDLDAAAAAFRASHGRRLRIATKYHRLVREFLKAHEVADYALVDSQGATEGTVRHLSAEAVADITSTGATFAANHLKILSDGRIHASEAVLFRSLTAGMDAAEERALAELAERLKVPDRGG